MFEPGTILGEKYQVQSRLGEGAFGEVYAAENTWTGKRVAIKTLRAAIANEPMVVQRFMQEARSASRIEHPNVVQVFDLGHDKVLDVLFIVQELLQGQSLDRFLDARGGPLHAAEAIALILPVMEALEAAHRQGVVHRDVKPANVIVATDSRGRITPKVIDFGISKIVAGDDVQSMRTRTGIPMGTPLYMSPEQAQGDKLIDAQSDVWSVGVMLFEMVSKRFPFEGNNHNVVIANIIYQPCVRLERVAPHAPAAFVDVVHRAIEKDRAVRFATMGAFLDALRACSRDPSLGRASLMEATTLPDSIPSPLASPSRPASSPSRPAPPPAVSAPVERDQTAPWVDAPEVPVDRSTQLSWTGRNDARRAPVAAWIIALAGVSALVTVLVFIAYRRASRGDARDGTQVRTVTVAPATVVSTAPPTLAAPPTSEPPSVAPSTLPSAPSAHAVSPSRASPQRPPRLVRPVRDPRPTTRPPSSGPALDIDDSFHPRGR